MKSHSKAIQEDLSKRLRRVEGQARGVQKMLEAERDCQEIVQQLKAMQAAIKNATALYMRAYAKDCLLHAGEQDQREQIVDEFMDLMAKVS